MTDQPTYPYQDGDVTVLGPEIFASKGGSVICWRGENYIRQQDIPPRGDEMIVDALHELASGVRDLASAVRLENVDRARSNAEAAIARVRELAERWQASVRPGEPHPAAVAVLAALDEPGPATTEATELHIHVQPDPPHVADAIRDLRRFGTPPRRI